MPYRLDTKPIPAGSLNLNLPNDLLPADDSIALHNWRMDASGVLRSRLSTLALSPAQPAVGYVHTIFRMGNDRFYGSSSALYKGTTSLATGFEWSTSDPRPFGMAAYNGYLWVMNRGKQGRYNPASSNWETWLPDAPSSAPTGVQSTEPGGGLVEAITYSYYVTFMTADGQETNPSPVLEVEIASGKNAVTITRPNSSDARVTRWNLYRIGNTLDDVYRVNPTPNDYSDTTFLDDGWDGKSDDGVVRLGITMPLDHDAPPAAAGLAGPYFDSLLAFNSEDHPNWLWWTDPLKPHYWPGAALDEGNHAPVGEDDDPIVAITLHPGHARIYKRKSVWRLRGRPGTGVLEQTNAETGLVGARAIASVGGLDYFQAQEGIYVSNGDTVKKLTPKLDPIFSSNFVTNNNGAWPTSPMNGDEGVRSLHCLAVKNDRLYFSYADDAHTTPNILISIHLPTMRMGTQQNPAATTVDSTAAAGYTALYYEGQYGELLGATSGITYALEYSNTDTAIPLKWTSSYQNQGTRDRQKTYADLTIDHSTVYGATLETLAVKAKFDAGTTSDLDLGNIVVANSGSGPARQRTTFRVPASGNEIGRTASNIAVQISGAVHNDVVLFGADVHFYLEPRDARTYDSGETDLGDPGVKEMETLEIDIRATGTVSYRVLTDLPGGVMTLRKSGTFPATNGRQVIPIPLDWAVGKLVRVTLDTPAGASFRTYDARLRHRTLGLYRDGAAGEVYAPLPQAT